VEHFPFSIGARLYLMLLSKYFFSMWMLLLMLPCAGALRYLFRRFFLIIDYHFRFSSDFSISLIYFLLRFWLLFFFISMIDFFSVWFSFDFDYFLSFLLIFRLIDYFFDYFSPILILLRSVWYFSFILHFSPTFSFSLRRLHFLSDIGKIISEGDTKVIFLLDYIFRASSCVALLIIFRYWCK